ncbi:MAG: glycosyltransferase family 39 protein [bacterium]|nr:glycosyltransferase family 39 protein [bacterium]
MVRAREQIAGVRRPHSRLDMTRLWGLALVVLAAALIGVYRVHHDRAIWTPDGAIYLRLTLQDRGAPERIARDEANRFMRTTAEVRNPKSRGFYDDQPPLYYRQQFALFQNRPIYPALAAALYPRFGPGALKIVSGLAYVLAVPLVYIVLAGLVTPWIAALGALGFATAPAVLEVAGLAMTDELALLFWVAALGTLLAYLRAPRLLALAAFVVAALALTFTRPAAYLPFGAAAGAYLAATPRSAQRIAARRAAVAALACGILFLAYDHATHGAGLATQLRWQYAWQQQTHGSFAGHGFAAWWLLSVVGAVATELVLDVYKNAALFVVVLAAFGILLARRSIVVPVAVGAAIATLVPLVVNPLEVQRTVTLPLTPLVVILATLALGSLAKTYAASRAPRSESDAASP